MMLRARGSLLGLLLAAIFVGAIARAILRPSAELPLERSENVAATGPSAPQTILVTPAEGLRTSVVRTEEGPDNRDSAVATKAAIATELTYRLRVLSEDLRPLASARARIDGHWETATGMGTIDLEATSAAPTVVVGAPGYRRIQRVLTARYQTIVLERDTDLGLRVQWENNGLPVAGAQVTVLRVPTHSPWRLEPDSESISYRTDEAGHARLFGIWNEESRASIRVEHPGALPAILKLSSWVRSPELGDVIIELHRSPSARFKLVDELGVGMPRLPSTILVGDHCIETMTDDLGNVDLGYSLTFPPDKNAKKRIGHLMWVELGEDRRWVYACSSATLEDLDGQVFRVSHVPVGCTVRNLGERIAECATAFATNDKRAVHFAHFPSVEHLEWVPVSSAGTVTLRQGWQGYRTCVLVRDRETGTILASELVHGSPVSVDVPPMCMVTFENQSPSSIILLRSVDRGGSEVEYDCNAPIHVVRGTYAVSQWAGSSLLSLPELVASGPESQYTVPHWPPLSEIGGRIRGSLTGPYAGRRLDLSDGSRSVGTETAADGSFHFSTVCQVPCELSVSSTLNGAMLVTPMVIPSETQSLDLVIPEGRLVLEATGREPEERSKPILLSKGEAGVWRSVWQKTMDAPRRELLVASGEYRLYCQDDERTLFDEVVHVGLDEKLAVDVDRCFLSRLNLDVRGTPDCPRPQSVRLRDPRGRSVREGTLDWSGMVGHVAFDAPQGEYTYTIHWLEPGNVEQPVQGTVKLSGREVTHSVVLPSKDDVPK